MSTTLRVREIGMLYKRATLCGGRVEMHGVTTSTYCTWRPKCTGLSTQGTDVAQPCSTLTCMVAGGVVQAFLQIYLEN